MPAPELLKGPYRAPALKEGDRTDCLFRDCLVAVTGWSDGPIPWPRGLPVGERGHPSLVVDEHDLHPNFEEDYRGNSHELGEALASRCRTGYRRESR